MEKLYTEKEVVNYMVKAAEAAVDGYRRGLQKRSILVNTATVLILAPAIILVAKLKGK